MSNFGILIPFILLASIIILIYGMKKPNKMMKSKTNKVSFRMNRSTHFKILLAFIALLVVLAVTVEVFEPRRQTAAPLVKVESDYGMGIYSVGNQIMNGEKADSAFFLEKRVHLAGDTLTIKRSDEPFEGPTVYIERKRENDGTIEEFLYKPLLTVDDYDFSDKLEVVMPVWAENTVTFPKSLKPDIEHTNFQEATILKQLTTTRFQASISMRHGSTSIPLVVHLKVPMDLEIIDPSGEIIFIDE